MIKGRHSIVGCIINIILCLVVYEGRWFDCAFDNEPPVCAQVTCNAKLFETV